MNELPGEGRRPDAVLFDLDGTLIDSLPDLADALDDLLGLEGHARLGEARVRPMIGHGVEKLVQRGFAAHGIALDGAPLAAMADRFRAIYEPRATRLTRLYPHVEDAVRALAASGMPMAVCTNKPTAVSREILADFGLADIFPVVVGGDFGPPRKPAPDLVLVTAQLLGVHPANCLFVGDSPADVGAARAAGMPVIVVGYGYTAIAPADLGADRVIADFRDLGVARPGAGRAAE
ncbi:phosphoglycolate phosphatase [Methylobrevis pamukkalensis]|uniref:Phosphoglycolate phosphatase n=1 Tax=Methylobrevis pamukkalensis TaxID=1439726 RepID=A0A1E3H0U7_9HYPH|nr:phosphoglycolate phosphatase [Methylobrevis pamukkalensis]ODN69927.1 Phosphoglycolate phosphatase [Methylobrevis pamukkalensis]